MKISNILKNTLIVLAITCNFGCDQITKNIVRNQVEYHENIPVIDSFLTVTKVENTGAFLSLGSGLPVAIKYFILNLVPALVLLYGLYLLIEKKNLSGILIAGLCFVIGGGMGNVYDRMRFGSVTDFLHLNFGIFQTGIFNTADMSIMIGMAFILVDLYFKKLKVTVEN